VYNIPREDTMARGISLHIGLNRVDQGHYGGWDGSLNACEMDARDMQSIARTQGFRARLLLTRAATHPAVTEAIRNAARLLTAGDFFFLSYSGHGGQVKDLNGDEREDHLDETWVLYDREMIDDELYALWSGFERGVRILMLSDSCHSGTVARESWYSALGAGAVRAPHALLPPRLKHIPARVQAETYRKHRRLYERVQCELPKGERIPIGASVLLLAGCQENQLSADGDRNGLFTGVLRRVWSNGKFRGTYRTFHRAIARLMPPWQTPNFFRTGAVDPRYEQERPFTL
jgi:metacaspase-1